MVDSATRAAENTPNPLISMRFPARFQRWKSPTWAQAATSSYIFRTWTYNTPVLIDQGEHCEAVGLKFRFTIAIAEGATTDSRTFKTSEAILYFIYHKAFNASRDHICFSITTTQAQLI
jgi:hypothetical protein